MFLTKPGTTLVSLDLVVAAAAAAAVATGTWYEPNALLGDYECRLYKGI